MIRTGWWLPVFGERYRDEWNLYENKLSTALQLVAYTGVASDALADGGIPSELTNSGMFPKAWRAIGYQAVPVQSGSSVRGLERRQRTVFGVFGIPGGDAYGVRCGALRSGHLEREGRSTCELFSSKGVAFVPFGFAVPSEQFKRMNLRDALAFFARLGESELEKFKSMLVFDALVFNEDRHMGNYGVMRDSATGEIRGMAPIFDNNMSLFAGAMPNELKAGAMLERGRSRGGERSICCSTTRPRLSSARYRKSSLSGSRGLRSNAIK